jgi:hypothetical protein
MEAPAEQVGKFGRASRSQTTREFGSLIIRSLESLADGPVGACGEWTPKREIVAGVCCYGLSDSDRQVLFRRGETVGAPFRGASTVNFLKNAYRRPLNVENHATTGYDIRYCA